MTDRERWIVYPLLFFGLGMAMWNGMEQQAQQQSREASLKSASIDSIHCKQLIVMNENQTPQIVLTTNSSGGVLSLLDRNGKVLQQYVPAELPTRAQHQQSNRKDTAEPSADKSE